VTALKPSNLVKVGIVGKPHGIRGAFFLRGRDEPLAAKIKTMFIGYSLETAHPQKVVELKGQVSAMVVQILGCDSREAAQGLVGQGIWVERDNLAIDENSEFYWSDLIGKPVVDSIGANLGKISEIYRLPGSDVMIVKLIDGRTVDIAMIPAFVAMDFTSASPQIHLTEPADFYLELASSK